MGYPRKKHQQQQFNAQRIMKQQQVVQPTPLFDLESNCHDLRRSTRTEFEASLIRMMEDVLSGVEQCGQRIATSTKDRSD